jgi:hypothetical protein
MNTKLRDEYVTPFSQCFFVTSCPGTHSLSMKSASSRFSPKYQILLHMQPSPPLLLLLLMLLLLPPPPRSNLTAFARRTSRFVLLPLQPKLLLLLLTRRVPRWRVISPPPHALAHPNINRFF